MIPCSWGLSHAIKVFSGAVAGEHSSTHKFTWGVLSTSLSLFRFSFVLLSLLLLSFVLFSFVFLIYTKIHKKLKSPKILKIVAMVIFYETRSYLLGAFSEHKRNNLNEQRSSQKGMFQMNQWDHSIHSPFVRKEDN